MYYLHPPAMLNVIAVRKKFKCEDNLSNHINTLTQKVPKNVYQSRRTAVAHIVCSVAAAMLTLFTAHTHTHTTIAITGFTPHQD